MGWETPKFGSKGGDFQRIIHPGRGEQAIQQGDLEISEAWFNQAAEYWKKAVSLSPDNYAEAQNRSKITGRSSTLHQ